ncbi:MAG: acyl carrier protein [Candidatus Cloacimonadota bacterium]|nr:MAG: acyl carrier protein [Candidatus Cloacimonadota bacterium]
MNKKIKEITAELLDLEAENISEEDYLVRDLEAESIDLLEIGISLNAEFGIHVSDSKLFLRDLRLIMKEAENENKNPEEVLSESYPHLSSERIKEIIEDLPNAPVIKIKDVIAYAEYEKEKS